MSEIVKREELPDGQGWLEYSDDGRIQAKSFDGRFIQHPANYVPPESARAVKEGRTKRRSTATLSEVDDLLSALPPEVLQDPRKEWIIRHLAASLVTGGAGTASVARELLFQIQLPRAEPDKNFDKPKHGEVCKLCGQPYLSDFSLDSIEVLMREWQMAEDYCNRRKEELGLVVMPPGENYQVIHPGKVYKNYTYLGKLEDYKLPDEEYHEIAKQIFIFKEATNELILERLEASENAKKNAETP